MARQHRRFRICPRENDSGVIRERAFAEGVLFSDGTICVRLCGAVNAVVVFQDRTVESLVQRGAGIFRGPAGIEWLDGRHER